MKTRHEIRRSVLLDAVSDTFFIAEYKKKTIKRLFVERQQVIIYSMESRGAEEEKDEETSLEKFQELIRQWDQDHGTNGYEKDDSVIRATTFKQ